MTTSDFSFLLLPLPGDLPTGRDLRLVASDVTLERIETLRKQIDMHSDPSGPGRSADWQAIAVECQSVLTTLSKDLQVAVWLAEAWGHLEGFAGLGRGFRLMTALVETFWARLHPGVEEDGAIALAVRVRPLNGLGSPRGLASLRTCPIVRSDDGEVLTWEQYRQSEVVDRKGELSDRSGYDDLIRAGLICGEQWFARLRAVPDDAIQKARAEIAHAQGALAELMEAAGRNAGPGFDGLHWTPLCELLGDVRDHLEQHGAPAVQARESTARASAPPLAAEICLEEAVPSRTAGRIGSRREALQLLQEIAIYFRENEPHSPMAALIGRAVRWGSLPFEQVLRDVLPDESALRRVWETLGIRPEPPAEP